MSTEQQQQVSPYQEFRQRLNNGIRQEIKNALPPEIDVDRFIRTVLTSVQMNPDLLYADRRSLMNACMRAAQDGLFPDGREAVLNIYNTKVENKQTGREEWVPTVQYLPMVKGIIKVMRNSGEVASIDAAAVYEKDHFKFVRGDDPHIEHEPYDGADDPGQVKAAYMIVKLASGEVQREVMYRRDIEKVKSKSKQPNGLMWGTFYDQAAIKSVIKRGAKLLPTSSERLERLIQHDNEAMGFDFGSRVEDASAIVQAAEPVKPATPAAAAVPAVTDQRAEQDARRPSRMAGIVNRAKQAEPVTQKATNAKAAAAGLPADQAPAGDMPPWEDGQLPLQAAE